MADDPDVLDKARTLIEDRLKELDDERKRLEKALGNLTGESSRTRPSARLTLDAAPAPAPQAGGASDAAGAAAPAPTTPSRRSRHSPASPRRRSRRS